MIGQAPLGWIQRRYDLEPATAATQVGCGAVFFGNINHAIFELVGNVFDINIPQIGQAWHALPSIVISFAISLVAIA